MNKKNDLHDVKKLQSLIASTNDPSDIFFNYDSIKPAKEPYDIKLIKKSKQYHIQLTEAYTLVIKNIRTNKRMNAEKYVNNQKNKNSLFDSKLINKNERKNIGTSILKTNAKDFEKTTIEEQYFHLTNDEEDLDQKYRIASGYFINALVRAIKNKTKENKNDVPKYKEAHKKQNSILVIYWETKDTFNLKFEDEDKIIKNQDEINPLYKKNFVSIQKITFKFVKIFFISCLNAAIKECFIGTFFDLIKVYIKVNVNIHKLNGALFITINNKLKNKYPLPNNIYGNIKYFRNTSRQKTQINISENIENEISTNVGGFGNLSEIKIRFPKGLLKSGDIVILTKDKNDQIMFNYFKNEKK